MITFGIQETVALLLLGGSVGGFIYAYVRGRRNGSGNGGTGVMRAVLQDQSRVRGELWRRMDELNNEQWNRVDELASALTKQRVDCDEKLAWLGGRLDIMSVELEECRRHRLAQGGQEWNR